MGSGPDSTLTINQGAPSPNYQSPAQRQANTNSFLARYGLNPSGQPLGTPAAAPDLTDAALKQSQDTQSLKLLAQRGTASTFVSGGGLGDAAEPMLKMPKAKGG